MTGAERGRPGGRRAQSRSGGARGSRRDEPLTRERAWEYLLNILSRRAYTVAELERKLRRRGAEAEVTAALLARLIELRLANDVDYTEQYVSSRKASRGRLALAQELRGRGVEAQTVGAGLAKLDHEQQVAAAETLLLRNAWRYRPVGAAPRTEEPGTEEPGVEGPGASDDWAGVAQSARARSDARFKAKAKAFGFLARRGFDPEAAAEAIERTGWFMGEV